VHGFKNVKITQAGFEAAAQIAQNQFFIDFHVNSKNRGPILHRTKQAVFT